MNFNEEIEKIMQGEKPLSYSSLKAFLKSPKHFKQYKLEPIKTEAMQQGIRFHMAVLEPDKFKAKYWFLDDAKKCEEIGGAKPRATSLYKEWALGQMLLNPDKELIPKDEYDLYIKMRDYLTLNSVTKTIMNDFIYTEKSFQIEHDGFLISGKIDGEGSDSTTDLKKVVDASFKRVRWLIKDEDYHMQGAMYLAASGKSKHNIIFIDNSCNVTVVKLCRETLEDGFSRFELALKRFTECAEQDLWDSSYEFYNNGFIEV